MAFAFDSLHSVVHQVGSTIKDHISGHDQDPTSSLHTSNHRFASFAPRRENNDVKWYVDGASYMYAVSLALEQARESVWILDWWLSPELYLRRPPSKNEQYRLDRMLQAAAERGVKVHVVVYKEVTQALTHHLESLHPNICVFRHPDHLPDARTVQSTFLASLQKVKLTAANASRLPIDAVQALYGVGKDTVLYWAHHEKLCLIDGKVAFMGGLDLCYGRWDTNQHSIADVSPTDLNRTIFPGQDYNNARIMDFHDVDNWQNNKLDRTKNCRMGWSDVSLCLAGPAVEDLRRHFAQRWNFIYDEKYHSRTDSRYEHLKLPGIGEPGHHHFGPLGQASEDVRESLVDHVENRFERMGESVGGARPVGVVPCQLLRSCTRWSHGSPTEHSIANAYIEVIKNSQHFVYIENQFFITATCDEQKPIRNQIGAAIVERILRAAHAGDKYKIIIVIPAIPAFAGDLRSDAALSTRAIMEFQYRSINRDNGKSIMERIAEAGYNPMDYIRFYNLRNYDRINAGGAMSRVEDSSGVSYDEARRYHDDEVGAGYAGRGEATELSQEASNPYHRYQRGADGVESRDELGSGSWNSVAECYMLGGEDIRNVPWESGNMSEIDAFVSEELYVHSKLLIADDHVVICGSANLNDRSQLGDHDSEIAILVEDPQGVDSRMNGQQWRATRFASSLRRQIMRKHLGLLQAQDINRPDNNFQPLGVPNAYDWGSAEDEAVLDPLSDSFLDLWNWRARTNTEAFEKVFHPVPSDGVKNWKEYGEYYENYFQADPKKGEKPRYEQGHVITEDFRDGGVQAVKEILASIKGTLVEMPLMFLEEEDIAQEGLSLNAFTEEVYT